LLEHGVEMGAELRAVLEWYCSYIDGTSAASRKRLFEFQLRNAHIGGCAMNSF
jgi:hypothetical protein